jgi:hypothetical protein
VVADGAKTEVEDCETEDEKKEMAEEGQTELSKEEQVGVTSVVYCSVLCFSRHWTALKNGH